MMTGSSAQRSRLAGTLTTPDDTGRPAGVDASCSTIPQQPDAVVHRVRYDREEPMSDLQAIADRVEIEALRGEFTDAVMLRDYDRVASLFTPDGALRMPNIPVELAGRDSRSGSMRRAERPAQLVTLRCPQVSKR
jgi:hypothetical protein